MKIMIIEAQRQNNKLGSRVTKQHGGATVDVLKSYRQQIWAKLKTLSHYRLQAVTALTWRRLNPLLLMIYSKQETPFTWIWRN